MEEEDLFDEFACDDLENLQISSSQNSQNSTAEENKKRPKKQPPKSTTPSYDSTGGLRRRGPRTPRNGSAISSRSSISGSSSLSSVSGSGSINGSRSSSSGGIKQDKFSDVDESRDRSHAASNISANSAGFSKFGSEAHSRVSAYQDSRIQPDVRYGQAKLSRSAQTTEIYKKYYTQQRGAGGIPTGKLLIPENVGRDDQGRPLPIMESSEDILQNFDRQQVTLISGETGSGKSTVVPQLILDHMVKNNQGGCIWVTQPRRIAAITIAERVANSRKPNWRAVGQGLVGYQVGLDKNACQDSRIIYMTPGIVSCKMQSDRELRSVRCLIIDEVHERDVETEMLLLLAKHLIRINKDIRVILMSATMTPEQFKKYLTVGDVEPAVVKAKGRPYEVRNFYMHDIQRMFPNRNSEPVVFYAQQDNTEISPAQRTLCIDILKGLDDLEFKRNADEPGAVLIFLPGLYEINSMKRLIQNVARQYNLDFTVERLHSSLPRDRDTMNRIITKQNNPPGRWRRKIVLSTNMGESSITISDCSYVIDFCLTKYTTKHDTAKLTRLVQNWASKEMCEQRSGRAGRTKDGMCFRIIDKKFWDFHIPNTQKEEILRVPLDSCVLLGKSVFPNSKPIDFLKDALARPNDTEVLEAVRSLKEVGALTMTASSRPDTDNESDMALTSEDLEDGMLTPFGKLMNLLPIDQTCVRLIQLGYMVGMTYEAIIIAACSSVEAFWNYNKDVCEDEKDNAEYINAYKSRLYWASGTYSDHIAMMNAFLSWYQKMPETYMKNYTKREHKFPKLIRNPQYPSQLLTDQRKEIEWTQKMGLNAKALREVHMLCEDIIKRLISAGYHLGDEVNRFI